MLEPDYIQAAMLCLEETQIRSWNNETNGEARAA